MVRGPRNSLMYKGGKKEVIISTFFHKSRMGWAGHVARMGEVRSTYTIFFGELEWK
jgi:hypothetical protein